MALEIKFSVSTKELAVYLAGLHSEGQAEFFNELAEAVRTTYRDGYHGFAVQMEGVRNAANLTNAGRLIQRMIGGDY